MYLSRRINTCPAVFLGSLIAPVISVGVALVMNMEFRLPDLPFRALEYGKLILIMIPEECPFIT
jgi:hypothetical protein